MKVSLVFSVCLAGAIALPRNDINKKNVKLFEKEEFLRLERRIVGGEIATPKQFPYQVGIRTNKIKGIYVWTSWCGGALISDQFVLTAAHCLDNTVSAVLYLGSHNRNASFEMTREMFQVKKENFIMHEKYDPIIIEPDIGLIRLPKKVELNEYINIVKLPKAGQLHLVGRVAVASGWGKTGDKEPTSDVLRFVYRKILDNNVCKKFFGLILKTQLCVEGSDRKTTCQGDSGGPLIIEESDGSKVVVGLTSFGRPTCEQGFPVVFTRVNVLLKWINKHTGISIK
uniref:limulus clotting factor C n=1 Tax=Dolopus genitalis TaxID=2488630 RepID=A0A3G5BIH5_DOLGE|nr:venom polypeptide [Dolopus genitalis]